MSTQNLYSTDAKEKIKKLAKNIDFAMMATNLTKTPFSVIPMSTKKVDEDGNIWFLSGKDSDHNRDIKNDKNVQLIYSDKGSMQFLSVFGTASITTEKMILNELYSSTDDSWFDGKDDPNISAIKFEPKEAYYWDSKSNKIVTLFKMGVGAVTGEKQDVGRKGELNV